jgi:hypothetical protein
MKAHVGDKLVILGHRIHKPVREAEIVEVRGADGEPPYRVRWYGTDHVTLIFPGPDAHIEPAHRVASPEEPADTAENSG